MACLIPTSCAILSKVRLAVCLVSESIAGDASIILKGHITLRDSTQLGVMLPLSGRRHGKVSKTRTALWRDSAEMISCKFAMCAAELSEISVRPILNKRAKAIECYLSDSRYVLDATDNVFKEDVA